MIGIRSISEHKSTEFSHILAVSISISVSDLWAQKQVDSNYLTVFDTGLNDLVNLSMYSSYPRISADTTENYLRIRALRLASSLVECANPVI